MTLSDYDRAYAAHSEDAEAFMDGFFDRMHRNGR